MNKLLLVLMGCLLLHTEALAQTVSIINNAPSTSANLVEASLKRHLRAEGYTVKGGTTEGIAIVLSVMETHNRSGMKTGVVGHAALVTTQWQEFADLALPSSCKAQHALAKQIKGYVGAPLIYLNETVMIAGDEEELSEGLATYSNQVLRPTFKKMQDFINDIEKRAREGSSDVINPIR